MELRKQNKDGNTGNNSSTVVGQNNVPLTPQMSGSYNLNNSR